MTMPLKFVATIFMPLLQRASEIICNVELWPYFHIRKYLNLFSYYDNIFIYMWPTIILFLSLNGRYFDSCVSKISKLLVRFSVF